VRLTSESVQSSALTFQSIYDVHSGHGLPLGVLGVCDGISDDIFQENLEDSTGFFVDQPRDTFDTTSSRQSTDSGFCDTLDVITKNFSVTLSASLSKSFSSFTASRHFDLRMRFYSEFNENDKILLQILDFNARDKIVFFPNADGSTTESQSHFSF